MSDAMNRFKNARDQKAIRESNRPRFFAGINSVGPWVLDRRTEKFLSDEQIDRFVDAVDDGKLTEGVDFEFQTVAQTAVDQVPDEMPAF